VILWAARAWVRNRRQRYHSLGHPLASVDIDWLSLFHDPGLLARVHLCRVPLHLNRIAGVTYGDVILMDPGAPANGRAWERLVFHELVHVVQYDILGIDGFIDRYLRGWAAGGCRYMGIPLEKDAYAIEAMFTADPRRPFLVRDEVEQRLAKSGERLGA